MEPLNYLSGTPGNPMTDSYDPVNLAEFEALARQRVSQEAWDYVAGGADDEITLRENIEAYRRIKLRPRMLIDVSTVDPSTTVLSRLDYDTTNVVAHLILRKWRWTIVNAVREHLGVIVECQ